MQFLSSVGCIWVSNEDEISRLASNANFFLKFAELYCELITHMAVINTKTPQIRTEFKP